MDCSPELIPVVDSMPPPPPSVSGGVAGVEGVAPVLSDQELLSVQLALEVADQFAAVVKRKKKGVVVSLSASAIEAVLKEAIAAAAESYGVRACQLWADGFQLSKESREQDLQLFRSCGNDFTRFVQAKRQPRAADRLSEERVTRVVDPAALSVPEDFARLLDIARGIVIQTDSDFTPRADRENIPMRKRYTEQVSHAVNKLLHKQWLEGTVVLLPTSVAETIPGVHFSFQHWALKAGKACGRSICDVAYWSKFYAALNGVAKEGKERVRAMMRAKWGTIEHPTVAQIALMIWEAAAKWGPENIVLWKLDLAGAFNLMDFHPDSAKLLAFELTEDMTVIHITGMFGWTGTPYCFQVITRVLTDLCGAALVGFFRWYVDDLMAVSPIREASQDVVRAKRIIRDLLGPNAVAEEKDDMARRLVCIGWVFDVDTMTVSISRRNLLKTIHAFFVCDVDKAVAMETVERMASYASRYAMLCRHMTPYTTALNACVKNYGGNRQDKRTLSRLARADVYMWRAFLMQLSLDEKSYARPLHTFAPRNPTILIEFDASLTGFGVGVSRFHAETAAVELIAYTGFEAPYSVTSNSSMQNTHEYMGVIIGLLLVLAGGDLVEPGFAYDIIGDSATSLSWCCHDRAKSAIARRADIGFSLLSVELDATLARSTHIPGKDNVVYDGLSRGKSGPEVGLPAGRQVFLAEDGPIMRFVHLCNPNLPEPTVAEHKQLTLDFLETLSRIVAGEAAY